MGWNHFQENFNVHQSDQTHKKCVSYDFNEKIHHELLNSKSSGTSKLAKFCYLEMSPSYRIQGVTTREVTVASAGLCVDVTRVSHPIKCDII